jgi:hypothetical protein
MSDLMMGSMLLGKVSESICCIGRQALLARSARGFGRRGRRGRTELWWGILLLLFSKFSCHAAIVLIFQYPLFPM